MNKLLVITSSLLAASSVFGEFSAPALNVDAKVEFNTADVYEGRRRLDQSFAPSAEIGLPFLEDAASLYVGVGAALGVGSNKSHGGNEVTPYVGFSYDITEMFTFDVGYTLHSLEKKPIIGYNFDGSSYFDAPFLVPDGGGNVRIGAGGNQFGASVNNAASVGVALAGALGDAGGLGLDLVALGNLPEDQLLDLARDICTNADTSPHTLEGKKQSHEIYAGIMADVLLSPSLYFYYDFTQEKANIDGAVHYAFDLGSCGVTGFAIDFGGKIGYTRAKKPYGIKHDTKVVFFDIATQNVEYRDVFDKTCWFYAGANADLVYSLNENAKARAGVAFSYNNAKKDSWINARNHKKHNVWFSSAVEFSF